MKRGILVLLALTALFLVTALRADPSSAQTKVFQVGILNSINREQMHDFLLPFYQALGEHGWVEGKNVVFEFRNSGGDPTRLAEPAAELVRRKVDVLFPVGPASVRAAFAATRSIPIVAHDLDNDPVDAGYAQSYRRPGGNVTGVFIDSPELAGKWVELLNSIVHSLSRVVVLWDPTSGPVRLNAVRDAAAKFAVNLQVVEVRAPADINKAKSAFGGRAQAMIIVPSPVMWALSKSLAQIAKRHRLPAISMLAPFVEAGGLLVYGPDMPATSKQCGELVAKIFSGARTGDLPIERPAKFFLAVNLKTAHYLGLTVPDTVLLAADRVIHN